MKKILSLALSLLMILGMCTVLSSCGDDNKLTMATNASFPPYEYKDGDTIVGIDAEIAAKLAEKLGMPYQTLINLYLRDCAVNQRQPQVSWR